jgi:predicted small secreted protein
MTSRNTQTLIHRPAWAPILFAGLLLSLAGCNTFRGVGEDVEAGGRAIGNAAESTSEAIDEATD